MLHAGWIIRRDLRRAISLLQPTAQASAATLFSNGKVQIGRLGWARTCGFLARSDLLVKRSLTERTDRIRQLAAATLPLIVGVSYGDNPYSWGSAIVLGPMIVGIVMFFAYAAWEWKGTSTGTLAHVLFGNRNLPIAMLGAFLE